MASSIQLIFIVGSEDRKASQVKQLEELKIPFPVHFLEACTPLNSASYLPVGTSGIRVNEICCLKSHIRAIEYSAREEAPAFSMIVEENAAFHTTEFIPRVLEIIEQWDRILDSNSHMVSIGWLPMKEFKEYATEGASRVFPSKAKIFDRCVFGTQAYLMKKSSAKLFTPILRTDTFDQLKPQVLASNPPYVNAGTEFHRADRLLNHLFLQSTLFPPCVIEQDRTSLLNLDTWNAFFKGYEHVRAQYWSYSTNRPSVQSFDFWDTLVAREVKRPIDIFEYMRLDYALPVDFQQQRMRAEQRSSGSFDSIYDQLQIQYGWSDAYKQYVKHLEIITEIKYIIPVRENLRRVKEGDIIVSDMYLPERAFRDILTFLGVSVKDITFYITPGGKREGMIWPSLLARYSISLHLGDNPQSDILSAANYSIPVELTTITDFTSAEAHFVNRKETLAIGHALRRLRLDIPYEDPIESAIWLDMMKHVIPVMVFFSSYVYKVAKEQGLSKIRFLTRDCHLYQRIFERMYPTADVASFVSSRYLNGSNDPDYKRYLRESYDDSTLLVDLHGSFKTGRPLFLDVFGRLPNVALFSYQSDMAEAFPTLYYLFKTGDIVYTHTYEKYVQAYQGKVIGFRQTGTLVRNVNEYAYGSVVQRAIEQFVESIAPIHSSTPFDYKWLQTFINSTPLTAFSQFSNHNPCIRDLIRIPSLPCS